MGIAQSGCCDIRDQNMTNCYNKRQKGKDLNMSLPSFDPNDEPEAENDCQEKILTEA